MSKGYTSLLCKGSLSREGVKVEKSEGGIDRTFKKTQIYEWYKKFVGHFWLIDIHYEDCNISCGYH